MSVTAAIRRMMAAGLSVDQALIAAEAFEVEHPSAPPTTARQERNRRYYQSRRLKASYSDDLDVSDDQDETLSPKETSPTPPKENTPSPKTNVTRGSRIPSDFLPDITFATAHGLTVDQARSEAAKFADYWRAKSGQGATKLDWGATWRVWVRTAKERLPVARGQPPRPTPITDAVARRLERLKNEREGSEAQGHPDVAGGVPRLISGRPN